MNCMWYGTGFFKLFVFIETTNGNVGMMKVWFGYALMEPGNIFFSHVVIKPHFLL